MSEVRMLPPNALREALGGEQQHYEDAVEVISENTAEFLARSLVRELVKSTEQKQPAEMHMLCMGAGAAKGELKLAQLLRVPQENVTLVDKQYQENPGLFQSSLLSAESEGPRVIPRDMLAFIEQQEINPSSEKFDVLTFFGMEYVLNNPDIVATVLQRLEPSLADRALVTIFPLLPSALTDNLREHLAQRGFSISRTGVFTFERPQK